MLCYFFSRIYENTFQQQWYMSKYTFTTTQIIHTFSKHTCLQIRPICPHDKQRSWWQKVATYIWGQAFYPRLIIFHNKGQTRWKFRFTLTSILIQWLLQNFYMARQLCCRGMCKQKFVVIWWPATELQQDEFSIEFELHAKMLVKRSQQKHIHKSGLTLAIGYFFL